VRREGEDMGNCKNIPLSILRARNLEGLFSFFIRVLTR
jgi:hypothetical protein